MIVSEARLAANRANAQKSTGPKTLEGKERSRANSLQHGMTGAGIVLPAEDAAEVERRFAALRSQLAPTGEYQEALVKRVALHSVRMDRCAVNEAAAIGVKIRHAEEDFDEAREDEVDRLMAGLADEPASGVRKLRRMPEGVDRMIAAWLGLRADVACKAENRWAASHRLLAENLTGRRVGDPGISRVEALARAIRSDFALLDDSEGAGLPDLARAAWARERMAELIDAEVANLRAHRETLDLDAIAADRVGAADRALFDPSAAATLARKYDAAAERGFYRAFRDLKAAQNAEEHAGEFAPDYPLPPLASFSSPRPRDLPPVDPDPLPTDAPRTIFVRKQPTPPPTPAGS